MNISSRIGEITTRVAALFMFCLGAATSAAYADSRDPTGYFAERFVTTLTAEQALTAMDRGVITSEQYVRILLRRIKRHPELNALVHVDRRAAIAAARAADRERAKGKSSKPLLGLPIVIKDSFNTADLPTTVGTPSLLGFQPGSNAAIVEALLDAGAIILAKGNLHELQAGYLTNNPTLGVALSPYGRGLSPGGSSGGNAAALAARLVPLAIGADTAGSIRTPAALTGTVGFRPTSGRYARSGIAPLAPTFDSAGPMARSVRDLALVDAVITGEPNDLDKISLDGLRIGVPGGFFRLVADQSVFSDIDRIIERLEQSGAEIVYADLPGVGPDTIQTSLAINFYEALPALSAYLAQSKTGVSIEQFVGMVASEDVRALLKAVEQASVPESVYKEALGAVEFFFKPAYVDYVNKNELDAVLLPTNPVASLEQNSATVLVNNQPNSVFEAFFAIGHYIPLVGAPAVTISIGDKRSRLPAAGIDIAGLPGDDRRVLAIAAAIEKVVPSVRPPLRVRPVPFWWHWTR